VDPNPRGMHSAPCSLSVRRCPVAHRLCLIRTSVSGWAIYIVDQFSDCFFANSFRISLINEELQAVEQWGKSLSTTVRTTVSFYDLKWS
jgi:hypothetical protein